ncbi:MAG: T9SS type A sorting domain-containing protein, partial [Methanococcaceae archaeon]
TEADRTSIFTPIANINSGFRQIAKFGNTGFNNTWKITIPETLNNFVWGVQAIDNSFKGSAFEIYTPPFLLPLVYTDQPTGLDLTSIDLNGRVNPQGKILNAWFEYGTDTNQLISTPMQVVSGENIISLTSHITGLQYNTVYYYRILAGTAKGEFVNFQTQPDGIEEDSNQFVIYPNPTNGYIKYSIKDPTEGIIIIYDMKGQKRLQVLATQVKISGTIDLHELEGGIYNLIYVTGKSVANSKIIVE